MLYGSRYKSSLFYFSRLRASDIKKDSVELEQEVLDDYQQDDLPWYSNFVIEHDNKYKQYFDFFMIFLNVYSCLSTLYYVGFSLDYEDPHLGKFD